MGASDEQENRQDIVDRLRKQLKTSRQKRQEAGEDLKQAVERAFSDSSTSRFKAPMNGNTPESDLDESETDTKAIRALDPKERIKAREQETKRARLARAEGAEQLQQAVKTARANCDAQLTESRLGFRVLRGASKPAGGAAVT